MNSDQIEPSKVFTLIPFMKLELSGDSLRPMDVEPDKSETVFTRRL